MKLAEHTSEIIKILKQKEKCSEKYKNSGSLLYIKSLVEIRRLNKHFIHTVYANYIAQAQNQLVTNFQHLWFYSSKLPAVLFLDGKSYSEPQEMVNSLERFLNVFINLIP